MTALHHSSLNLEEKPCLQIGTITKSILGWRKLTRGLDEVGARGLTTMGVGTGSRSCWESSGPPLPITLAPCVSTGIGSGGPEPPPPEKPFPQHVPQAMCHPPSHAGQPRLAPTADPHPAAGGGRVQRETQQQLPVHPLQLLVRGAHALRCGQQRHPESPAGVPHCAQPGWGPGQAVPRQRQQPGGSGK